MVPAGESFRSRRRALADSLMIMRLVLALITASALFAQSASSPEERKRNLDSFEKVWSTIRDKHWEERPGGLDWQAIHEEYRPLAEKAATIDDARKVMSDMLARLKQTHFGIIPSGVYGEAGREMGDGSPGIELRLLAGKAIVTRLEPGASAEKAGVKLGWEIVSAGGDDFAPAIAAMNNSELTELTRTRALQARLTGAEGSKLAVTFVDGANAKVTKSLTLEAPRGQLTRFGNLPPMSVWTESRKISNVGYYRFNIFLDPERVIGGFGDLVGSCLRCDGMIIDVRGNPGGIGGMAMGMASQLIDKPNQRLGAMRQRGLNLNFVVNPGANVFAGPVAVLVDGNSASTSEIFAGGLHDLGRARVFGTKTAAAALPSILERLPNGDGFQYAVANYISEGGKPLEGLGVPLDEEVSLTRAGLLAGRDAVIDAALQWIQRQGKR